MQKKLIKTGMYLLLFFCNISCTGWVWEDRSDCPCILTLDLQRIPAEVKTMHLWIFGAGDRVVYRNVLERKELGKAYTVLVKREQIRYFIWGNIQEATELKDGATLDISLAKREGVSADSLYFYSGEVDTRCEYAADTIVPGKEFATVQVIVKNHNREADLLKMELLSNSSGFYVDRRFLSGHGSISAHSYQMNAGDAFFSTRIVRQASLKDIRISLTSYYKDASVSIADYPLGKWLSDNQYDMQAVNLSDILLEIDYSANFITIQTEDWQTVLPIKVDF